MRKSRKLAAAVLVLLLAGLAFWIYNSRQPPKIVGILPDASSVLYANLAPVRAVTHFDQKWDFEHDAAYDDFVKQTGIQPARDLNQIAMAIQGSAQDRRYSEALRGNFDSQKLQQWLERHADSTESYGGKTIFTLIHEGRPVRVTALSSNSLAISNTNDIANIHAMVDHNRSFFPRASALVRSHYSEVPTASSAWWIAGPDSDLPGVTLGSNYFDLGLPPGATLVGSLRYTGALQVRLTALTTSEQEAGALVARLQSVLKLARALVKQGGEKQRGQENDFAARIVNSISLEQSGSKAALKADIPDTLLEELARPAAPQTEPR